jgi:hypothetical protein
VRRFDGLQFAKQSVVLGIRYLGVIENVVLMSVMVELASQLFDSHRVGT